MASLEKVDDKNFSELEGWMTLQEAAQHLSILLGKEVNEARVLKYVLNRRLKLSVNILHGTYAKHCLVNIADLGEPPNINHGPIELGKILMAREEVRIIDDDIYDLPMIGAEMIVVKHKWRQLNGDPVGEFIFPVETVVEGKDGKLYILQELQKADLSLIFSEDSMEQDSYKRKYVRANGLPEGSVLVVRTGALHELEERLTGKETGDENQTSKIEEITALDEERTEQHAKGGKSNLTKVLDPDHPWRSNRLELAIRAWEALYADRTDSPADFKPAGGNIKVIVEWLKKNAPTDINLKPTTIKHMASVINPDRSKGPGKTKG